MKKMFTRKSGEGVSESHPETARYEPKITIEEYTSAKIGGDSPLHLHLQSSLHRTIVSSNSLAKDNLKVMHQKPEKHKSGGENVRPWINSSINSYATTIYYQVHN